MSSNSPYGSPRPYDSLSTIQQYGTSPMADIYRGIDTNNYLTQQQQAMRSQYLPDYYKSTVLPASQATWSSDQYRSHVTPPTNTIAPTTNTLADTLASWTKSGLNTAGNVLGTVASPLVGVGAGALDYLGDTWVGDAWDSARGSWLNKDSAFDSVDPKTGMKKQGWFNPLSSAALGTTQAILGWKMFDKNSEMMDKDYALRLRQIENQEEDIELDRKRRANI